MASRSLVRWETRRAAELNQMESAHAMVGGTSRGRRYATEQINHAYAMLLSSQFQGFCRDLHSEAVDHIVIDFPSEMSVRADLLRRSLILGRKLDRGNPNPGNLGSDFGRLGLRFWDHVKASDTRSEVRLERLESLNTWRNAIAHQDFSDVQRPLGLQEVRKWRNACRGLARTFDRVVARHLAAIVGNRPW